MDDLTPPEDVRLVFVSGGVSSSLGKGVACSALARLMKSRGFSVHMMKLDGYLNTDPGTLAPSEHGEAFVTDDGAETDLDLGSYERFLDKNLTATSSVSAGKVYSTVLAAERRGDFLGHTVQVVPHIVEEIARRIYRAAATPGTDVLIVELGGTVGDMEVAPFLEAIRRIRLAMPGRTACAHLVLVPEVGPNRELKTKPAQHAVAALRGYGIVPDLLLARASKPLGEREVTKLSRLCGLPARRVLSAPDVPSIYAVPDSLGAQGYDLEICDVLGLEPGIADMTEWRDAVANLIVPPAAKVRIGVVAKYIDGADTYISVCEALNHAAAAYERSVEIHWIDSEGDVVAELATVDAVVVPGGFGTRGVEGMVAAAGYARTTGLPYLGLCLGLQVAVVDVARNAAGIEGACSGEWGTTGPQVITILEEQRTVVELGGTMRLGGYDTTLVAGTRTAAAYGLPSGGTVRERHRHRFEVNPAFVPALTAAGLIVAGTSPDGSLVEHIELDHPCFLATQAHPEFLSRPNRPHPLFSALIRAATGRRHT